MASVGIRVPLSGAACLRSLLDLDLDLDLAAGALRTRSTRIRPHGSSAAAAPRHAVGEAPVGGDSGGGAMRRGSRHGTDALPTALALRPSALSAMGRGTCRWHLMGPDCTLWRLIAPDGSRHQDPTDDEELLELLHESACRVPLPNMGDAICFDSRTLHCATANVSTQRRALVCVCEFQNKTTQCNGAQASVCVKSVE